MCDELRWVYELDYFNPELEMGIYTHAYSDIRTLWEFIGICIAEYQNSAMQIVIANCKSFKLTNFWAGLETEKLILSN